MARRSDIPEAGEMGVDSVYGLLLRQAERRPAAEAIRFLADPDDPQSRVVITRQELVDAIARAANVFRSLGVGPRDTVAILAGNQLEVQSAFWGAELAGICFPINTLLSPLHIAELLRASKAKVLVTLGPRVSEEIWGKAMAAVAAVPGIYAVVAIGGGEGAIDFAGALASASPAPPSASRSPDRPAAYFHTGGTTGAPKLVIHTHANQIHAVRATGLAYGFDENDAVMCGLPMFHVAGPILLSLAPLAFGARVILPTAAGNRHPRVLARYWDIAIEQGATFLGGVPTTLSDLLEKAGETPKWLVSSARCMTGGAQLSAGLQERFQRATGLQVQQVYGMTETAGVICIAPSSEPAPLGSVGRPGAGIEIKILGAGSQSGAAGVTGEIHVRGDNVSPGYLSEDGPISMCDDEGWLPTGDLGHVDADGWLFVTGRSKDVIIRSGHNIDPAAIEEVARAHPAVADAVAVGRPDARAGEVPVVFLKLAAGAELTAQEALNFIVENIAEAPGKPADVILVDSLPVTAVGKIFRPALRAQAVADLVRARAASAFPSGQVPGVEAMVDPDGQPRLLVTQASAANPERWREFSAWINEHTFRTELRELA